METFKELAGLLLVGILIMAGMRLVDWAVPSRPVIHKVDDKSKCLNMAHHQAGGVA